MTKASIEKSSRALALALLGLAAACGGSGEDERGLDLALARERAAAHYERGEFDEAQAELAVLLQRRRVAVEDRVRAAIVAFALRVTRDPSPELERLRAAAPQNPVLNYLEGRAALEAGESEEAVGRFRVVLEAQPGDLAARLGLATALGDLDRNDEARELLDGILAEGLDHAGPWYVNAVDRLARLALLEDEREAALHFGDLLRQLRDLGYRAPTQPQLDRGTLPGVLRPAPAGTAAAVEPRAPGFGGPEPWLAAAGGEERLALHDLDGDGRHDLVLFGPGGLRCAWSRAPGPRVERVVEGPVDDVHAFDLGNDGQLDLWVVRGGELHLFRAASGADVLFGSSTSSFEEVPLGPASSLGRIAGLVALDHDHEGDLDLLVVGEHGARLLRNDGAAAEGGFVDVSEEAGLSLEGPLEWCVTEDFDGDQDVDVLVGGRSGNAVLLDNARGGRFVPVPWANALRRAPLAADLDGDARVDLFEPGSPARIHRAREGGGWSVEPLAVDVPAGSRPVTGDVDLDGTLDVLWAAEGGGVEGLLAVGLASQQRLSLLPGTVALDLAVGDVDDDLDLDLVTLSEAAASVHPAAATDRRAVALRPLGLKDNRRAVGAVVEVRSGGLYRRIYWRGAKQLVGLGGHERIDVLRLTWPNGVVQTRLDVGPSDPDLVDAAGVGFEQPEGLVGSCPFLYAWNGTTFEFVTDVLGGTPLGLPMAPGRLVPPDHDEYVLVRGDQLRPRDGRLELQFTEELREVTYLDAVRLDVLDHPADAEVYPDERFCFPPFPPPDLHVMRELRAPRRAVDGEGRDWTEALARVDDLHAIPFEPLAPQLLGLATHHSLELHFDPEDLEGSTRQRLVCTGWFYWTDASVNMAAARIPGVSFLPPVIEVPGPDGTWRASGPPVGFPAGKSKTMVVDVTDILDPDDPRLRLVSTLRLYWDSIRLATDGADAPLRRTSLDAVQARLYPRGFSRPIPPERSDLPERFDWDLTSADRRWDQHPGRYTRYGDVRPLLGEIDDRYVIMGSGDALALSFDARALPPLEEGWTRDYVVFLDGWAKDRDPNTVEALTVEPLPFHGMSGYPYGPDESFPDTAAHREWRAGWNTRPARRWIAPLSPERAEAWARSGGVRD